MKILKERKTDIDIKAAKEIAASLNVSLNVAKLLMIRGVTTQKTAKEFLYPSTDLLYSPLLLKDMDRAVLTIQKHIKSKNSICILGDYDADGVTSTALLFLVLKQMGANVSYYIPSRQDEGYGLTMPALENVIKLKPNLVITVDCGVTSVEETAELYSRGVEVVITDHHKCPEVIPVCEAAVNPNRLDCEYPFKGLAGVGVAAKLCEALTSKENVLKYADLIALGTIADLMPLLSENRIFVKEGLLLINGVCNLGIKKLIEVSGLKGKDISARDVAFMIAPRVNAGGRMDNNSKSVELFITNDEEKAEEIAINLNEHNTQRQQIVSNIQNNAIGKLEAKRNIYNDYAIIIADATYNHSVIGIVASKLAEKYYRPAIVLGEQDGMLIGSARSINGIDIHKVLSCCSDLYERFGGHAQAAGLTFKAEHYPEFISRINEYIKKNTESAVFVPNVTYDLELELKDINEEFVSNLAMLEPFGMENPKPDFCVNAQIKEARKIGNDGSHLKFIASENGKTADGVAFSYGHLADKLTKEKKVNIICKAEMNEWNGNRNVQLNASYIDNKNLFDLEALEKLSWRFYDAILDNVVYNYNVRVKTEHLINSITVEEIRAIFNNNVWSNVIFCGSLEAAELVKQHILKDYDYYDEYMGYINSKDLVYNAVIYAPIYEKLQDVWVKNAIFIDCDPILDIAENSFVLNIKGEKILADRESLLKCYSALKKFTAEKAYNSYEEICEKICLHESEINLELLYTSIKIFKELNLIEIEQQPMIRMRFFKGAKADLQSSTLYIALNNISR